jgi:hypothetical protein
MELINLNFQLTFKDFIDLASFERRKRSGFPFWLSYLSTIFLEAFLVILITYTHNKILLIVLILIAAFIFLALLNPLFSYNKVKKAWEKNTAWHHPLHYEFSESGLKNDSIMGKAESSWDAVDKAEESEKALVLILQNDFFHLIPKRAFKDPSEVDQFKNLLRDKVKSKNIFLDPRATGTKPKTRLFDK